MTPKPTFGDISARFLTTPAEPAQAAEVAPESKQKRGPTIILPKRYCANEKCRKLLPQGHKYPCCSFKCSQEHKATMDAIEAGDKVKQEYPF